MPSKKAVAIWSGIIVVGGLLVKDRLASRSERRRLLLEADLLAKRPIDRTAEIAHLKVVLDSPEKRELFYEYARPILNAACIDYDLIELKPTDSSSAIAKASRDSDAKFIDGLVAVGKPVFRQLLEGQRQKLDIDKTQVIPVGLIPENESAGLESVIDFFNKAGKWSKYGSAALAMARLAVKPLQPSDLANIEPPLDVSGLRIINTP